MAFPCIACACEEAGRKEGPPVAAVSLNTLVQVEMNGFEAVMRALCRRHHGQFNTYAQALRDAQDKGKIILVGDTKH